MPEEEESNRPKLIIPESEDQKSKNRLLVPDADQETGSASPKPQLVIDDTEETQAEETQAEETQAEETQAEEAQAEEAQAEETQAEETQAEEAQAEETPQGPVNVVEMSPPANEEEVIGQLPQPQEDDWMKDAYEQVAHADRAAEVMNESVNESSSVEPNVEQPAEPVYQAPAEPVYQAPAEPVYQAPVESPLMAPQVAPTPQLYAQQQVNPYQNVQPYYQAYSVPPAAGAYPYQQQGMPANAPTNQQVPVGQPRGIPGPVWALIGLIIGVLSALLIFKFMPISVAENFRPDLVEKGKTLVKITGNVSAQNQSVTPVVPVPKKEESPSDPEAVPDSDPESE